MKNPLIAVVAFALVFAACSGTDAGGVASLEDSTDPVVDEQTPGEDEHTPEDAILGFAQCMRDNGIEDFEDPDFTADGSLDFRRGQGQLGTVDPETMRQAFEACQEHVEGLAFGPGNFDRSEIADTLVAFAACRRDPERGNLPDFPDPDLSSFGQGNDPGGGPFAGEFDFQDPAVQEALEACQDVVGGFRFGGPGRGPGSEDGTGA
jgi:hypothetical protein